MSTAMFLRLCSRAPRMRMNLDDNEEVILTLPLRESLGSSSGCAGHFTRTAARSPAGSRHAVAGDKVHQPPGEWASVASCAAAGTGGRQIGSFGTVARHWNVAS